MICKYRHRNRSLIDKAKTNAHNKGRKTRIWTSLKCRSLRSGYDCSNFWMFVTPPRKNTFWRYLCSFFVRKHYYVLPDELHESSNFITKKQSDVISLYNIMSTIGYGLLPMLILGVFGIIFTLKGTIGILLSLSIAFWSSLAAGNAFEVYLREPHNSRKLLLVYPLFLFYLSFAMNVIFWKM